MKQPKNWIKAIFDFYWTGFQSMTIGRTLWLLIAIKIFILFFILRLFFFPNFLNQLPDNDSKSNYVGNELIKRIK